MKIQVSEEEIIKNSNNFELGKLVRQKYWNTRKEVMNNRDEKGMVTELFTLNDKIEKCVVCGRDTRYTSGTHIDMRVGYVEGAGQGCDGSCGESVPY
jgi:hypothetical protein